MPTKAEILLAPVPRGGRIVEIDPTPEAVASTTEGWNVTSLRYLKHQAPTSKAAGFSGADCMVETDYVWDQGSLADAVPSSLHNSFDALLAHHVIEQTPDILAFLASAAALLKPDGVMVLTISDKRYCFDYFQPLTTTGQVIAARDAQFGQSRERLFEHYAYAVENAAARAWGQHPINGLKLVHTLEEARSVFASDESGSCSADTHGWRFSPSSFQLLLLELARLGDTDWRVERITEAVGCEFFVWLRRGGLAAAGSLADEAFRARRLTLLKRTLLEARAQIDWLLAGEPELVTGPLGLLPTNPISSAAAVPPPAPSTEAQPASPRYVDWFPVKENAGRAFDGEWSSAVPGLATTGQTPLFDDVRITLFEERLGGFSGRTVLELGPLEGGHTYMMTQRGATVTAIESNLRAWMRCLVVKDALGIANSTFLLGDFVKYLAASPPPVDFALASGILYHMTDPAAVLQNLCRVGNAIGLWTHYFDPDVLRSRRDTGKFDFKPLEVATPHGRTVEYYGQSYLQALEWPGFCGGSAPGSNWMRRQDILGILEDEGFSCETFLEHPDHPNGPAFCVFGQQR